MTVTPLWWGPFLDVLLLFVRIKESNCSSNGLLSGSVLWNISKKAIIYLILFSLAYLLSKYFLVSTFTIYFTLNLWDRVGVTLGPTSFVYFISCQDQCVNVAIEDPKCTKWSFWAILAIFDAVTTSGQQVRIIVQTLAISNSFFTYLIKKNN